MTDYDPSTSGGPPARQPWFGPKRMGYGYGPRTWQGWLVTAILVGLAIAVSTLAKHDPALVVVGVAPLVVVPFLIMWLQRR
jgi:hypothetical protein